MVAVHVDGKEGNELGPDQIPEKDQRSSTTEIKTNFRRGIKTDDEGFTAQL